MMSTRNRGFTLIELMIGLAVFAFLILIAGPQYAEFLGNSQIRNGAENTLTGVRVAQAEAVRGNVLTQFVFNPTPCTGGWQVNRLNDESGLFDQVVQSYTFSDGACRTTPNPTPAGATQITFNGLGRVVPNIDASATIQWIEITNTNLSTPRNLRVVANPVTASGIKLCDPDPGVTSTDPRFCPVS
ncbi:MAG: GspH/FimT family protein [Casimicrobiaceae bacterium]